LRVFRRIRHANIYTKSWWRHWDSRRSFVFIAATLLILGLDIALASLIYRIARIYW